MALNGIDVSQYQGSIDWDKVKDSGIRFAMLRGGFGQNNIDPYFHQNAKECQRTKIPMGIYWFSYALNAEMADKEARYCIALAKQYKITWPLAYDLEYDSIRYAAKNGVTITKQLATDMARAFCETVKAAGYIPMNYMNLDYYQTMFYMSQLPYDLWLAQYASAPSITHMEMWQYTSQGKVPGISGNCDKNYSYKDYSSGSILPTPGPSAPKGYTIKPGDTLSQIAQKFGTTVADLASINNISDPDKIYAGQVLRLSGAPSQGNTYVVRPGDTLSGIAAKYGTTYQALAKTNGISDPDKIYAGQILKLPGSASSVTRYYTIQPGDTLSGIAKKFGTTVADLQSLNLISDPDKIYAGNRIRIS